MAAAGRTRLTVRMSPDRTPPHLARPQLAQAGDHAPELFEAAISRGFHQDYRQDEWGYDRAVLEPDRCFGFTVDDRWIATCGAYTRTLTVPGGSVPTAAVSLVTVAPSYRRRGLLNQMMTHQLEDVQRRGVEPVALLWASESLIYGRYGYGHATPRVQISGATRSTAFLPSVDLGRGSTDEVSQEEFRAAGVELHRSLLPARPGLFDRDDAWWDLVLHDPERYRDGASALRFALHYGAEGEVDGYAVFRLSAGRSDRAVEVVELDAAGPASYAAVWRYLLDLDLVRKFVRRNAPADEPLRHLVTDQRAITTELLDGTYVRLVDLPAALAARRYSAEVDVVVAVTDGQLPANDGVFRLQVGPSGGTATPTASEPDLSLGVRELGAAYLGGTSLNELHRAGRIAEHRTGVVGELSAAFDWPVAPFCPDFF